ncbi:MAG: AraC family transcriptional regulator [Psychroserpens sp.]|uniref:helix-turn-helix domain-containing protein n=1 Tax=Psychroserpens sp. TaxID=2020870 RepID=UPI0030021B92
MNQILHIKNMVCNRCISTVLEEFNVLELNVKSIELGLVEYEAMEDLTKLLKLETALKSHGFEIIREESKTVIEAIKIALVTKLETDNADNLTYFLSKRFDKSYSVLSKLFSKTEGVTIEKYEIQLKIEKVKERIQHQEYNFSEIAFSLNYNNSSHLAKQFKSITGMSMTQYKKLQDWNRKAFDQIV